MKCKQSYLQEKTLSQIAQVFKERTQFQNIRLKDIFEDEDFRQLQKKLQAIELKEDVSILSHKQKKASISKQLSKEILNAIQPFLDLFSIQPQTFTLYEYGHRDYSMLTDKDVQEKTVFDIIIDCSDEWDEQYGGSYIYIDEQGEYIEIEPIPNSITIIKREKGERFFTKYINHFAQNKKKRVLFTSV